MIAEKRARPGDDLADQAAARRGRRPPLDDIDFQLFFLLLVDAGGDTTRNLVAGGMLALFEHPDELRLARARDLDALLPQRAGGDAALGQPGHLHAPHRDADAEIGGRRSARATRWSCTTARPTATPRCSPEPDRFDLARAPNEHIAFGGGPHVCLGQHIARIEIDAMLREVLTRMPDIELAGAAEWLPVELHLRPEAPAGAIHPGEAEQLEAIPVDDFVHRLARDRTELPFGPAHRDRHLDAVARG